MSETQNKLDVHCQQRSRRG